MEGQRAALRMTQMLLMILARVLGGMLSEVITSRVRSKQMLYRNQLRLRQRIFPFDREVHLLRYQWLNHEGHHLDFHKKVYKR